MGFFEKLRQLLADKLGYGGSDEAVEEGPGDVEPGAESEEEVEDPKEYDRLRWRKRMQRILDELPGSQGEWENLQADARDLGFGEDWVRECQVDEFLLLVRRAVKDGVFTKKEHRRLDVARELMGLSRDEADSALRTVVAEAESFFGKPVEGA
jgi:hypothetical protein